MKRTITFLLAAFLGLTTSINAQDVTAGLVAKYDCENNLNDPIMGYNGFYTAEVEFSVGLNDNGFALEFEGFDSNGGVSSVLDEAGVSEGIIDVTGDFTISFWVRPSAVNTASLNILSSRRNISGQEAGGVEFVLNPQGVLKAAGRSVSSLGAAPSNNYILGTTTLTSSVWYHVVLTQNGTTGVSKLFINNGLDDQATATTPNTDFANAWSFGHSFKSSEEDREFNGKIDEIRFYDRELSDAEVSQLYNFESSVSVPSYESSSRLLIYPNPAQDVLSISSDANVQEFNIINAVGEQVYSGTKKNSIDVSNLKKGVYIIKCVLENNEVVTERFIKN